MRVECSPELDIVPLHGSASRLGRNIPLQYCAPMSRRKPAFMISTTEDLLKWEQGLFGGKVLQAASLEKMTTPFKNNYAFGLQVGNRRRRHSPAVTGVGLCLAVVHRH